MGHLNKLHLGIANALRGAGGDDGGSTHTPIESPDSLRSIAYARILDLVSEGEIYGFADQDNPLTCVYLNETPVANEDGSLNFKNIQIDSRVGTQTQDPMPNFDGVENETAVNVELRQGTPWVHAITNLNVNAFRVRLSVPALQKTNTTNGDITGSSVSYNIELQTDGGSYVTIYRGAFTGKTTTEYERSHRIQLPTATTGWTVRVTRITANSESGALQDATYVKSYTDIIEAKLRMPMAATVSVIVDAEQFGSIPSRGYHLKGRIIRVPTNYNPDTRTYTGVWDGTFQARYCNNPAWVFYDMATNTRYGLGHMVPNELVDKWALYRIAQYCDQLVPDGFGGHEPRFTCNLVLQTQNDALRVMQDLATVFRGIIYANGGSITAVADMPEDPTYTYTPANVIDGRFVYSGSSKKVRHTVVLVSWNDRTDFGRAKVEYVDDPDGIARYGVQQTEVVAIGCWSQSQARRLGRYILATERFETDTVAFGVGMDGTLVAPGKLVNIADPLRLGQRRGGRIKMATISSITVDFVPMGVVAGDTVVVPLPTGVTERRTIESVVDNIITPTEDFSAIPVPQGVWAVDSVSIPLGIYRILGVAERNDDTSLGYAVTAIINEPGKYGYADTGEPIETKPLPGIPGPVVPQPTGLVITQRDVVEQNIVTKIVNLAWNKVNVAVAYNVQWRQGQGAWMDLGGVSYTNIDIPNVQPGPFEVQVIAINAKGDRSAPTFGGPYDITPPNVPPGYVDDLITGQEALEEIGLENQAAIAQEIIDRQAADAATAATAATALAGEASNRAAADLAVAQAAADALLNEQLEREAAIEEEATLRQTADESLAQMISTITAGTGEQFDSQKVWYFDTDLESWTGNGTPTVTNGFLRPADSSDPYLFSPVGVNVDGNAYKYVKARIKQTGSPTWVGELIGYDASGTILATVNADEPTFEADGDATIDFKDVPWAGTVDKIRLKLSDAQTSTDYFEIDYVAIGRPTPGASTSALQTESTARATADMAEADARTTLAAQLRGGYTGTDPEALSSGLVFNERNARVTADEALASDITTLDSRITDAEGDLAAEAAAVDSLETRVTANETELSAQSDAITSLTSRIGAAEGVNSSQATAITNLTTRVTAAEGDIDTLSSQLTSLSVVVAGKASAAALNSLTTRVTTNEGDITALNTALTSLTTTVNGKASTAALNSLDARVTIAEGNITSNSSQLTQLQAQLNAGAGFVLTENFESGTRGTWGAGGTVVNATGHTSLAKALQFAANIEEDGADYRTVKPGDIVDLSWDVNTQAKTGGGSVNPYLRCKDKNGNNIDVVFTGAGAVGGVAGWQYGLTGVATVPAGAVKARALVSFITAGGTAMFTNINASVRTIADNINATATSSLEARVTSAEGNITSQATAITALTASIGDQSAAITRLDQVVASATTSNAVRNPSFELGTDGWTLNANASVVASTNATARTGVNYLLIKGAASGNGNAWSTEYTPVAEGQSVRIGLYGGTITTAPNTGSLLRLSIRWYTAAKTLISTVNTTASLTAPKSRWTKGSAIVVAPDTAAYMVIGVTTTSTSGQWAVEDISVEVLTDALTTAYATSGITIDVNGYVTGYKQFNDGTTSDFSIVADKFQVVSPAGGARTEYSDGNWRVYDAAGVMRVRLGIW